MKCPVCTNINLVMSERQGVEIDYCPECRGVWLDRGELDKIIERSGAQETIVPQAPQPDLQPGYHQQPPYGHGHGSAHGHGHGYGHKPYRKKSFLEELFD
jgi:Zn-finger nucleic acid-binding protein